MGGIPRLDQVCVRLELHVRRFYCQNTRCPRRTFAEPLRGLLDRHAQRTRRLAAAQRRVAVIAGGEAGTRLLTGLDMPTSADTRRDHSGPFRVIAVGRLVKRKGFAYLIQALVNDPATHGRAVGVAW